ncbi:MAG: DoxX family protein [Candidatus Nanoarchaeia archaeon]|nr:DoxX family protein [Candidatus Nanoarchaeia archaeon]
MKTSWAELLMRIALGGIFLNAGIGKLFFDSRPPVEQIITFLPADTTLIILGLVEFILGSLVLVGLFTKTSAKLTAVLMLIIIISGVYLGMLKVIAKDFVLLAAAWHLSKVGSDKWSLDKFFNR